MKQTDKIYFSNLDALRFISFFFIFLAHAFGTESPTLQQSSDFQYTYYFTVLLGKTGFSFAFVLSSYINTWVILEENKNSGGNFKPFGYYVRRALRIWPLYFLMLFIGFVVYPMVKTWMGEPIADAGNPWYFIFFIGNFYLIEHGVPYSPIVSVLWSLSVEEQFYITWPFLLLIFRFRIKWMFPFMMAIFMATTLLLFDEVNLFWHTLYLLGDIAMGALFAYISFHRTKTHYWLENLKKWQIISVYVLFWVCLFAYQPLFGNDILPASVNLMNEKIVFALLLAFFIFEQNFCKNSFYKFGKIKVLTSLGVVSYGLFCFHEPGILVGQKVIEMMGAEHTKLAVLLIKPTIAFALITPLAYLSFHYFEMPFLKLKRYFYSRK